jgi:DnaK suppressor protein
MPRAAKSPEPKKAAPAKKVATKAAAPTKKAAGAPADKFLESQRKLLLEEREGYNRQADSLRAEAEQLAAEREPGDVQFDEESGEGDTMNVERERDLALSAQAMASVDEIDKALVKIDAGTYGICEKCGEPIPKERLKALPYAALCVQCKSMGLSRR